MQGSVRALKAALKLHNYNSTRNKNSDTQFVDNVWHPVWMTLLTAALNWCPAVVKQDAPRSDASVSVQT